MTSQQVCRDEGFESKVNGGGQVERVGGCVRLLRFNSELGAHPIEGFLQGEQYGVKNKNNTDTFFLKLQHI
jgi:hypothetical protein